MKLRVLTGLLLFYSVAFAQKDSALITGAGTATGMASSVQIGSKGGRLQSADGKLEIVFPPNALNSNTIMIIQPISNTMAETSMGAYRLEPSGIRFAQPVKIIFTYSGSGGEAEEKGIASQDKNGLWWQLRKTETDTLAKTISGYITHFSDWQLFERLVLKPTNAAIKTNAVLRLSVYEYSADEDMLDDLKKKNNSNYSQDADLLAPLVKTSFVIDADELPMLTKTSDHDLLQPLKPKYKISEWSVNGIPSGNADVGIIGSKMKLAAQYKAPAKIPAQNPVAVTAKVEGISFKAGKQKIRNLYLTSSIKIVGDGYFVTFKGYSKGADIYSEDESSFLLSPAPDGFVIGDVINYPVKHTVPPKAGGAPGCTMTIHGLESWKGPVQVGTVKQTFVRPATKENPFTRYDVMFNNPPTAYIPAYTITCKGYTRTMPAFIMAGIPNVISFEVKGDEINIIGNEKRYGSYYKSPDQNGWFEISIKKM